MNGRPAAWSWVLTARSTVVRHWERARLWLYRELGSGAESSSG